LFEVSLMGANAIGVIGSADRVLAACELGKQRSKVFTGKLTVC
jgi:hypothetical protein